MSVTDAPGFPASAGELQSMVEEFFNVQCRYQAAIREIRTKLEILDDEFQMKHKRNPIHHMQSRMKSVPSMMENSATPSRSPITLGMPSARSM